MKVSIPEEVIERKIFLIRGQKVMLDKDLAKLYGIGTKVLNQAVKRNVDRFPPDFMFTLTREEITRMSQFVTSLKFSKNINVFTEQGVAMLSSVLHSKRAIQVNIQIMRAFVKLKELLLTHRDLAAKIEALEKKYSTHDEKIAFIFEAIKKLVEPAQVGEKRVIGFAKG